MAKSTVLLELSTKEHKALARLIGYMCRTEVDGSQPDNVGYLTRYLGKNNNDIKHIGCINAALNSDK